VIDSDGFNFAHLGITLSLNKAYWLGVRYSGSPIPAGGKAGFVVKSGGGLLDLSLLESITITTFDKNGSPVQEKSGTSDLLIFQLNQTGKQFIGFKTNEPFNTIRITVQGVNVGFDLNIYGAYGNYKK